MKVRYTPQAFSDRERILEYLNERSESGSRNVAASIREAVAQLGHQPHSGYRTDNPDVRVSRTSVSKVRCMLPIATRENPKKARQNGQKPASD
jgi:plasmid stabilization system protein ParE